ncbi:MAG: sortase [Dehalococcoidia bacterium]|nr:sortase [Dehalococcoidia bacterium]
MDMAQSSLVRRSRHRRWLGLAVVGLGMVLVLLVGGYYLYGWTAIQGLDSLVYAPSEDASAPQPSSSMTLAGLRPDLLSPTPVGAPLPNDVILPDLASLRLYPGERVAFTFWAVPWAAQAVAAVGEEPPQGFLPADQFVLGARGTLPIAKRMRIPAIEVDADVRQLRILNPGSSREYETPKNVVGHIPESSNPGEEGNAWFFGHLQSPIRGEGSIFQDLPLIPEILRTGQRVYVKLDSSSTSYLYEVYKTDILYQDDLRLYDTDPATITLVTCVPALTYDYRLLVTARLVGFKSVL